jgi:hypothetical protein
MYARFNSRRQRQSPRNGNHIRTDVNDRNGNPVGDGNGGSGESIPGYCSCGRPAGRTGRCATCDSNDRRIARRNEADNNKVPEHRSIRRRSKKLAALEAQYSIESKQWLSGKKCAVYPHLDATEVHHKKGRLGYANKEKRFLGIPLLLDKDHWLPVSHDGHERITNQSAWAFRMGFTELRSNESK